MVFAATPPDSYCNTIQFTRMKQIYALLAALLLSSSAFSQSHTIQEAIPKTVHLSVPDALENGRTNGVVDTIYDYFDRATDYFLLTAGSAGYTLGTNGFTREVAVHYNAIGEVKVTELMVFFTEKEEMLGIPDNFKAYAYTATSDSMPGDTLGRGSISTTDIDTAGFATFIPMTVEDSTLGDFLVSIDYYDNFNIDDSIAILSSNVLASNGGPDGGQEKRTRQRLQNGNWLRCWEIWNFGGSPFDADAMILPIVDYNEIVGLDDGLKASDLTLHPAWPNPAADLLHVPFDLAKAAPVQLTVFDASGRPVYSSEVRKMTPGAQELTVSTDDYAAGVYYFRLLAGADALAGKFVVAK